MYTVYEIIELSSYMMYILYFIKVFLELVLYKNFLYYKLSIKDINLSILFFLFIKLFTQNLIIYSLLKGNNFNDKLFHFLFLITKFLQIILLDN